MIETAGVGPGLPAGYSSLLADIKRRVRHAQARAVMAVNAEMIRLHWEVGALIDARQRREGWGAGVIPQLARDLRNELPEEKGFSERNIKRMLAFYREYSDLEFVPQPVAQITPTAEVPQAVARFPAELVLSIPWGHHAELMARVKDRTVRRWYMQATVEYGWSRAVLLGQVDTAAHKRAGKAASNFASTLPAPDSDLVQQALKDPYLFDFLTLDGDYRERELEAELVAHMQRFLLELGQGFAFLGRQYHFVVDDRDLYLDLLFFHVRLRRYIVVEIKRGEFKPEYAGKVNFYCNVVDDQLRQPGDEPTIGLILVQQPDRVFAEYTLRGMGQPIGVSGYQLSRALPSEFQSSLPTIEQIERELTDADDEPQTGE